jgi:hypothetical protein
MKMIAQNPGDENNSSVTGKSFKGSNDFSKRGLSSFSAVTKAGGLSSVTNSARKPLLDVSKGQLNSRPSTTSAKPPNPDKCVKRSTGVDRLVRNDIVANNLRKPLLRNFSPQISIMSSILR